MNRMHFPRARTCFLDVWQWERLRWRGEHAFWSFDDAKSYIGPCCRDAILMWVGFGLIVLKGNWFWDHKNKGHDRVICKSLPNWGLEPSTWLKLRTWMQICIEKVQCCKTTAPIPLIAKIGNQGQSLTPCLQHHL